MILPIVRFGNPVLRQKGKKVSAVTPEIKRLAQDMLDTMVDARGVGLAAQQIGKALQIAVVDITGVTERPSQAWIEGTPVDPESLMPLILINPEIKGTKTKVSGIEGCLSFPGITADISRSKTVSLKATGLDGETFELDAAGLLGRAIQHEFDHLQGKLFIDHLSSAERAELKDEMDEITEK